MIRSLFIVLLAAVVLFPVGASAEPARVVLLNPGGDHWFWEMTIAFMQAAAEDLDMDLEVVTSDWNHLLTVRQAKEVVSRQNPPDYIVTGNEKSNAGEIIEAADQAGVKIFLFSNGFVNPKDIERYGRPREKYKYWIGEMIPNNFSAGYQMGKVLIDEALSAGSREGMVNIAAIAGTYATHASVERVRGLKKVVDEYRNQVKLLQVVPGDWGAERAETISKGLFERYNDIDILWGVNDTTAMGAMNHLVSLGKIPGKDVFLGGCGWYAPALEMIREGTLTVTVGGHFMEAGWVMVLLHDYHHGKDFISDHIETAMYPIDKNNVKKYLKIFGRREWNQIDFRQFSKVYNKRLETYDFSLQSVLEQF